MELHLPDLGAEARENCCVLERYSKITLNASRTVLLAIGLAKTITQVVVRNRRVEACILPRPVERVEELNSEDCLHSFCEHRNLFGEA